MKPTNMNHVTLAALSLQQPALPATPANSEQLTIGSEGFTAVATMRLAQAEKTGGTILRKESEYSLGCENGQLCLRLHDGREWKGCVAGGVVMPGQWHHVAARVSRNFDPAQGVKGYTVELFVDGVAVKIEELLNLTVPPTCHPLAVGKGVDDGRIFGGEIAEVAIYSRAIPEIDFNRLLAREKRAQVRVPRMTAPDEHYPLLLDEARAKLSAPAPRHRADLARILQAVRHAERYVATQAELLPFLRTILRLADENSSNPAAEFAAAHPQFNFLENERLGVAFYAETPESARWCGLFDFATEQELLGEQGALWTLRYEAPGGAAPSEIASDAPGVNARVTINRTKSEVLIEWKRAATVEHPFAITAHSTLRLAGPRLSLDFDVRDESTDTALREAVFPTVRLRRLENGTDHLLVPSMSGVLYDSPVLRGCKYAGKYPSGNAHMQFFAYYDDRQGVYLGCEDPLGRSKALMARPVGDDCEISFQWLVGCKGTGGNRFATSGKTAIECFAGDWFDAAQIYKRFARSAAWWPASRTRQDTPEWYRTLSIWFRNDVNTEQNLADILAMREYLELPLGIHAYNWSEAPFFPYTGNPHQLPAKAGFKERVARLEAASVHVKPYLNARIWDTHDVGHLPPEPESEAYRAVHSCRVKNRDGSVPMEHYYGRDFAVMCPAAPFWQDEIRRLCADVAELGVSGLYLDQVSAGSPRACFDPSHPHDAGSGEAWLEQGYWPMLHAVRSDVQARYPQVILDSEDAAEPYMHVFDGFLPWRFVDVGHVPAHQAIYAGRAQMTGRMDSGDTRSKFPIAAEQLLQGEQLGWFSVSILDENPMLRLFIKKLAHMRQAFLRFFNEGDMLKPAGLASPPPVVTSDWGYYGPRIISLPAVLHAAWEIDGMVAVLFVNTSYEPVTAELAAPAAWGLPARVKLIELQEGTSADISDWCVAETRTIAVPAYGLAAWLIGADDTAVADAAAVFARFAGFEKQAGVTAEDKRREGMAGDPWLPPAPAPARPATEWQLACEARLDNAVVAENGIAPMETMNNHGGLDVRCRMAFGLVDFGDGTGADPLIECEVAVDPQCQGGTLLFFAAETPGSPRAEEVLARVELPSTGCADHFAVLRTPLLARPTGQRYVTASLSFWEGGPCKFKGWRLNAG